MQDAVGQHYLSVPSISTPRISTFAHCILFSRTPRRLLPPLYLTFYPRLRLMKPEASATCLNPISHCTRINNVFVVLAKAAEPGRIQRQRRRTFNRRSESTRRRHEAGRRFYRSESQDRPAGDLCRLYARMRKRPSLPHDLQRRSDESHRIPTWAARSGHSNKHLRCKAHVARAHQIMVRQRSLEPGEGG